MKFSFQTADRWLGLLWSISVTPGFCGPIAPKADSNTPPALLSRARKAAPPAAETFQLSKRPLEIPERGAVTSYVLQTSLNIFSFLPPPDWIISENVKTREVVMMAPSLATSIRFKISEWPPAATMAERAEQWRNEIRKKHPDVKITDEFPCYSSQLEGRAFDLERSGSRKGSLSTRLAFLPLVRSGIEFDLTTPKQRFVEDQFALGNLLTSFHVERGGTP